MRIYEGMTGAEPDARALLQVAPDDYVAERSRLVKLARAEHDRAKVAFYQSLKRPNLSLWAVLAAGGDATQIGGHAYGDDGAGGDPSRW